MGLDLDLDAIFLEIPCQWPLTGGSQEAYKDTDESVLPTGIQSGA